MVHIDKVCEHLNTLIHEYSHKSDLPMLAVHAAYGEVMEIRGIYQTLKILQIFFFRAH